MPLLVPFPGNEQLTAALAGRLNARIGTLELHRFPDGETGLRFADDVNGQSVILLYTLDRPDDKTLPLLFAAAAARDLGAAEVGLVAPYLAYMRQDSRFRPGEGITSTYFARILSNHFDWLVTIDPHLHRRSSLSEIYTIPAAALTAAPAIAAWIKTEVEKPVLVGPDEESEQWVSAVAQAAGAPYVVLTKTRYSDTRVEISVPDIETWRNHTPVLVDDIISTARTMIETVDHLKTVLAPPVCIGVHAVFAGDAYDALQSAGAARIVTCDTIRHPSNAIDTAPLLADGIRALRSRSITR